MPSASAKLEKQASLEANEPLKQMTAMVERKVRNLEKRKAKLDSYRSEFQSGKTLNEDQKKAIEKYDQVVEVLDFAKEMQKSFNSIIQETSKSLKKLAKREYLERQQLELQRIKEIVMIQDILNTMGGDDVRNDFINGANGAVKLTQEELDSLDELFKLISPERDSPPANDSDFDKQLLSAAEHIQSLLDAKNKEVVKTSYKALKDTILKIYSCNYFNKSQATALSTEALEITEPLADDAEVKDEFTDSLTSQFAFHHNADTKTLVSESLVQPPSSDHSFFRSESFQDQSQAALPEVLPVQGNLNFLQESQIDVDAPQLDQSTVPHSVPAGFGSNFVTAAQTTMAQQHYQHRTKEESNLASHITGAHSSVAPPPGGLGFAGTSLPTPNATTTPADFDPNRPIPTQTYTNQSFSSAIHPMMAVPQNYVPVTLTHPMPTHNLLQPTMVAQSVQQRSVSSPSSGILDPSLLPVSVHNQPNMLSVTSSVSKMALNAHDAKEHFVSRDYQMPQVSRDGPLHLHKTNVVNSQYERVNSHEGYQSTNNNQSYLGGHDTFSSDSSSYSSNLKRGLAPQRVTRGGTSARGAVTNATRGARSAYRA